MNKNQTTVLIDKNNDLYDIEIPRWEGKFHLNGTADVQFTEGYKDGKRVVNIAVQVCDKKTKFQYEGDSDDIYLEYSRSISLPLFYAIVNIWNPNIFKIILYKKNYVSYWFFYK